MSLTKGYVLLYEHEYCYILNQDSGSIRLEVGPKRIVLKGNEKLESGPHKTTVLTRDQYCVILNPFDPETGKYVMGERQVRVGPLEFALHYHEKIANDEIHNVHILSDQEAIEIESQKDYDDKPAGFRWQVRGPCRYVPGKYDKIVRKLTAILINQNSGIYVQNEETSEKKLIVGPRAYMLGVNESTFTKSYSADELQALKIENASYIAPLIHVEKGEVMCVLNYEHNTETVITGPDSLLLKPDEGVKVLSISAGKPKQPNRLKVAKVRLGPDFMSDTFQIRTKDNAQLNIHLTYKWQFKVDESDSYKVFALKDFIGYPCQTLCSAIREEAARHNFEEFHKNTVALIQKAIFKEHIIKYDSGKEEKVVGLYFPENKFLVSAVDVKELTPVNKDISTLLNQSVKSNMAIVCKKMEQEANLDAQKVKMKAQTEIQRCKEKLIDIQNKNFLLDQIEKAKIRGQAMIEKAKAEKEANEIKSKGELEVEIERMKRLIEILDTEEGAKYLELTRMENFSQIPQQWYIPSKSKISIL